MHRELDRQLKILEIGLWGCIEKATSPIPSLPISRDAELIPTH